MCSEKMCAPRRDIGVRTQTTEGVQEESGLKRHSQRDLSIQNVKRDVTWPAGASTILGFAPPVAAFIAAFAAFA